MQLKENVIQNDKYKVHIKKKEVEIYDLNNNLINVIKSYPSQIIYLVEFNKYNDLIIYTLEPYGKYLFVNYKFDKDLICIKRMNY